MALVGFMFILLIDNSNDNCIHAQQRSAIEPIDVFRDEGSIKEPKIKRSYKLVSRQEWLAQSSNDDPTPLKLPVPKVIIMHTATENCANSGDCILTVRHIQTFHIDSRKWNDIGYNFLIGGDGSVFVGRGWKAVGAHTFGHNADSIGIALVGTFIKLLPTKAQTESLNSLIETGVKEGYIDKEYKLYGATQLAYTESPGTKFFEELKKLPHFDDKPRLN